MNTTNCYCETAEEAQEIIDSPSEEEATEEPSANKSDVRDWETVTTYVSTFPSDDGDGACDVEVQVGSANGSWFIRTRDDAGGSDDASDDPYDTREAAEAAATEYATANDESDSGESAEEHLRNKIEARAGEPAADGEWCVYWETSLEDEGPHTRYASQEQAEAAAQLAQEGLESHNPGGNLLCGFGVRHIEDGEWIAAEDR